MAGDSENVMVLSAVSEGEVRKAGRGISVAAKLYDLSGNRAGELVLSWETLIRSADEVKQLTPSTEGTGEFPRARGLVTVNASAALEQG